MGYSEMIALCGLVCLIGGGLLKVLVTDPLDAVRKALDKLSEKFEVVNEDVIVMKRDLKTCFTRYDEIKEQVKELEDYIRGGK